VKIESLLDAYDLPAEGRAGVRKAYDVFREHHGPFIASIAAQMLPDLHLDAEAGHQIVFLGRDGHSFAAAVRALDPDFFAQHCREVVTSRVVVECAIQDLENSRGDGFSAIDGFRGTRGHVRTQDVPGAFRRLTSYLRSNGLPVGKDDSKVTLVDSSFKGTVQELLSAAYARTHFQGRYAFYGAAPGDPHPGSKVGYVVNLQDPDLTGEGQGLPFRELPAEPSLTFACNEAIRVIEDTLHGPLGSPTGLTPVGPRQQPQSESGLPLRGLNPALVMSGLRDPRAYEAAKAAALVAVHDAARAAHDQPSGFKTLSAHRELFTREVRTWLVERDASDPPLRAVLDSMVRREDRGLVEHLQRHFIGTGVSVDQAMPVWRDLAELSTLSEKQALADQVMNSSRGPQPVASDVDDGLRALMARRAAANPMPAAGTVANPPAASTASTVVTTVARSLKQATHGELEP
jgi:hypothetical protein